MNRDSSGASVPNLSLDAYFERVGYNGPSGHDLDTLNGIVRAHVQVIPFENLDVLTGRGVNLDIEAIWQKLVLSPRGGYCFEHNALLAEVLTQLGFAPQVLSARVRIGRPSDYVPARTHMVLRVELDGQSWLVDGGVGGLSPTAALCLNDAGAQTTPHETRRIVRIGSWQGLSQRDPNAKLLHQVLLGETWSDVCEFTLEEMPAVDQTIANWYLNTHPQSHFRDRLMVARASPHGRVTLLNRELTKRDLTGKSEVTPIDSAAQLTDVLKQEFGIQFDASHAVFERVSIPIA